MHTWPWCVSCRCYDCDAYAENTSPTATSNHFVILPSRASAERPGGEES